MNTRLILSSCDFRDEKCAKFITKYLPKPIDKCRVLYFPNENATRGRIKNGNYHNRALKMGFSSENIFVADYFNPDECLSLDIDVIYIGGGNTFGVIKRIRDAELDEAIVSYIKKGVLYIGSSAGAHIASLDFSHVERYDKNSAKVTDFSGLGLFYGIAVCHFSEERLAHFEELCKTREYPVIALKNSDAVLVENGKIIDKTE